MQKQLLPFVKHKCHRIPRPRLFERLGGFLSAIAVVITWKQKNKNKKKKKTHPKATTVCARVCDCCVIVGREKESLAAVHLYFCFYAMARRRVIEVFD